MSPSAISGPPPALDHAGRRHLEVAAPPGVDDDVAAGVGQAPRDRPPDALARAGDDGDPAVEPEPVEQRSPRPTHRLSTVHAEMPGAP